MTGFHALLYMTLLLVVTFAVQVLVLQYGWGLEVKNWGVVSVGFIFSFILAVARVNK